MFLLRAEELVNLQSKYQHFSNFLTMEDNQEAARLYYLQQLCDTSLGRNVFKSLWGGVILKNCGANGEIYSFKTIKEYKETQHQLWLYLDLKIFCYRDHAYPIFCCPQCNSMVAVKNKTWSSVSNSSLSKTFALCHIRKLKEALFSRFG